MGIHSTVQTKQSKAKQVRQLTGTHFALSMDKTVVTIAIDGSVRIGGPKHGKDRRHWHHQWVILPTPASANTLLIWVRLGYQGKC